MTDMITYKQASQIAFDYFNKCLNVKGIAEAMETPAQFVFCGGRKNEVNIGGITITVDKQTAKITVLKFPSKDSTQIINSAKELDVLNEFTIG